MIRSLDQERARNALEKAKDLPKEAKGVKAEVRQCVRALPAEILVNGLGQALATVYKNAAGDEGAEGNNGGDRRAGNAWIKDSLNDWFLTYPGSPMAGGDLLDNVVSGDQAFYVWSQQEALAYLGWLKKFVEAYVPKEEKSGETSGE